MERKMRKMEEAVNVIKRLGIFYAKHAEAMLGEFILKSQKVITLKGVYHSVFFEFDRCTKTSGFHYLSLKGGEIGVPPEIREGMIVLGDIEWTKSYVAIKGKRIPNDAFVTVEVPGHFLGTGEEFNKLILLGLLKRILAPNKRFFLQLFGSTG